METMQPFVNSFCLHAVQFLFEHFTNSKMLTLNDSFICCCRFESGSRSEAGHDETQQERVVHHRPAGCLQESRIRNLRGVRRGKSMLCL